MTDDGDTPAGVCQHPGRGVNENRFWADHPRADLRDRAWRRIQETAGYGLKFSKLVNELHGQEAIRQSDYDYNHLREFVRDLRREDYVRIERPSDKGPVSKRPLWIFPMVTPGASVLDTAVGGSVSADTKSDVEVVLGARRTLETAAVWGDVVGAFAGKRLGEQRADGGPERTRFNRVGVALRGRDRVGVAFDGALAAGSDHAVLVTATTDPARFESVAAAAEGLLGDVKALRKKLGRAVGESVLPGVVVPEPTARGVPHAHVPVFGAERASLPSKHDLHGFWWESRERGQQVDVKPLVADGGTWTWGGDGPADADGCPPRAYCQQGSSALATAAALAAEDLCAVASALRDRGDVVMDAETAAAVDAEVAAETGVDVGAVRDAAWYWATGLKAATRPSRSLRAAVDTRDAGGAADA